MSRISIGWPAQLLWSGRSRPARPKVNWHEGGEGPVLLLLNGWTASGLVWPRAVVESLEARYRVIRIDNRGTGWSRTAPTPFTIADLADDAAAVLHAVRAPQATVVGLSMGGMIAQELALRHPQLVERLVVAASRPPAPRHIPMDSQLMSGLFALPGSQSLADYLRSLWGEFCGPGFAAGHAGAIAEMVGQILERPTPRFALLAQARAIAGWAGADRLRSLAVPTVVMHGDADRLMPVGNGMRVAQLIPDATYIELAGVGHLVPVEAAEAVVRVLLPADRHGARPAHLV